MDGWMDELGKRTEEGGEREKDKEVEDVGKRVYKRERRWKNITCWTAKEWNYYICVRERESDTVPPVRLDICALKERQSKQ